MKKSQILFVAALLCVALGGALPVLAQADAAPASSSGGVFGMVLGRFGQFFYYIYALMIVPQNLILLVVSTVVGITFGALPGLTATLGIALLTSLTYGLNQDTAMIALMGIYVGAVYGGSYSSVLINIPGTPAAAATALDGHPLARKGEAGRALGLTTTASFIGTVFGMVVMVSVSPLIIKLALQFTSFEFFLLAFFGVLITGTLLVPDLVYKSWIAGLIGLFIAMIGRDPLQAFPRFCFGFSELEGRIDIVPVLLGAFGIPQIIAGLKDPDDRAKRGEFFTFQRVLPEWNVVLKYIPTILRSSLIGVGIGAIPGVGEDVAAWTAYGVAKKSSKHPEEFGKGAYEGVIASETANNSCIGGALIPLLTLGIPGSPPAAMLLGAMMIHNLKPGPMLEFESPGFLLKMTAILFLCALTMWISGMLLAKQVVKLLKVPPQLFLPVVGVLCLIGSYALANQRFNLYLMGIIGIITYFLGELGYPMAPVVIGLILGLMVDENLRRAMMVSNGSFLPIFQRPVAFIFFVMIIVLVFTQLPFYQPLKAALTAKFKKTA